MAKGRRHRLQSKRVEGEWLIPSMEAPSVAFRGKPKAVERELADARAYLLSRAEVLQGQAR